MRGYENALNYHVGKSVTTIDYYLPRHEKSVIALGYLTDESAATLHYHLYPGEG